MLHVEPAVQPLNIAVNADKGADQRAAAHLAVQRVHTEKPVRRPVFKRLQRLPHRAERAAERQFGGAGTTDIDGRGRGTDGEAGQAVCRRKFKEDIRHRVICQGVDNGGCVRHTTAIHAVPVRHFETDSRRGDVRRLDQ